LGTLKVALLYPLLLNVLVLPLLKVLAVPLVGFEEPEPRGLLGRNDWAWQQDSVAIHADKAREAIPPRYQQQASLFIAAP
jgi:hypothetical protein